MVSDVIVTLRFSARDLAAIEALEHKKGLNRSSVIRLALYHLLDFEGLRKTVDEKVNLLTGGAVSSAG